MNHLKTIMLVVAIVATIGVTQTLSMVSFVQPAEAGGHGHCHGHGHGHGNGHHGGGKHGGGGDGPNG